MLIGPPAYCQTVTIRAHSRGTENVTVTEAMHNRVEREKEREREYRSDQQSGLILVLSDLRPSLGSFSHLSLSLFLCASKKYTNITRRKKWYVVPAGDVDDGLVVELALLVDARVGVCAVELQTSRGHHVLVRGRGVATCATGSERQTERQDMLAQRRERERTVAALIAAALR
jgi:hypothetical protein